MNILFVCSGNVSRSFMAEMMLRNELDQRRVSNIEISSAGTYAYSGNPPDPRMVDYLSEKGIPMKRHESRPITKELVDRADHILVMEKKHAEMIEKSWPEVSEKVEHFGLYLSAMSQPDDIVDPYGRSSYHYRLAQAQITMAVQALLSKLLSDPHA